MSPQSQSALLKRLGHLAANYSLKGQPLTLCQKTKAHLLDTIGLMFLAADHPSRSPALSFLGQVDADQTSPQGVAFVGAVAAEALALDDFDEATRIHPGCVVVPALLGAGLRGGSGSSLLDGVLTGYEIACRAGALLDAGSAHFRGLHPTSIIGSLAAAAAVARFQGRNAEAASNCIGLAASLTSGLFELDSSGFIKGFQVGLAARNGLLAVAAHEAGYKASDSILDGAQGMIRAFGPRLGERSADIPVAEALQEAFASTLKSPRISFKPYTHFTDLHPLTTVLLDLLQQHPVSPSNIERVLIRLPVGSEKKLNKTFPPASLKSARRCPRFTIATIICDPPAKKLDPLFTHFQEPKVTNEEILHMGRLTSWQADLPKESPSQAQLELRLDSGTILRGEGSGYPGDGRRAETRWSLPEVSERFLEMNSARLGSKQAREWVLRITELDTLQEVGSLAEAMRSSLLG